MTRIAYHLRAWATAICVAGVASACALAPIQPPPDLVIVVVRHAEKQEAAADPRDPPLTRTGLERAARLSSLLREAPVTAVYSTDFRRTRDTAAPAAGIHGLPVLLYDASLPAADMARQLLERHVSGTVLVVAHSNTAPQIAAAVCGCTVEPLDESEYGRRMTITIRAGAGATFSQTSDP